MPRKRRRERKNPGFPLTLTVGETERRRQNVVKALSYQLFVSVCETECESRESQIPLSTFTSVMRRVREAGKGEEEHGKRVHRLEMCFRLKFISTQSQLLVLQIQERTSNQKSSLASSPDKASHPVYPDCKVAVLFIHLHV